jgi:hypothetical protein
VRSIILSCLLLAGCAQSTNDPRAFNSTDPTFTKYITWYTNEKGSGLSYDIPIQFADLSGNTVVLCTRWSNGYRQIQIDPYWKSLDEGTKYEIITHELGHCDLNLNHTAATYPQAHIMDPYAFSFNNRDVQALISDLFNRPTTVISMSKLDTDCVKDLDVESTH